MYHLNIPPYYTERIPIFERKWYIDKFTDQKAKEHEAVEKERRKARRK